MSDAGKWIKVWEKAAAKLEADWKKANAQADMKKIMAPGAKIMPGIKQTDKIITTSYIAAKDVAPKFAVPMRKSWKVCDKLISDFQKHLKNAAKDDPAKAKASKAVDAFNKAADRILAEMVTELAELEERLDSLEKGDPKAAANLKAVQKAGVRTLGNARAWASARLKDETVDTYNAEVAGKTVELVDFGMAALKHCQDPKKQGKAVAKLVGDIKKFSKAAVVPNDAQPKDIHKRLALLVTQAQKLVKAVANLKAA